MSPTLTVLGKLTLIVQTSDSQLRRAFCLGLFEEGVGLGLGVVAPFLLKATIETFQQKSGVHTVALVALLVASWTAPSAIAGLRLGHSTVLVRGLYGTIAEALLRHEIPRLSDGGAGGSGEVVGLLERLPLDLQLVLEGLVWRAAPLSVQTLLSLASLACTLSPFYAILMGATLATCAAIADRGAVRLKTDVAQANAKVAQASLRLSDVATNAHRIVCNGALDREVSALAAFADDRFGAQRQIARRIARSSALQALVVWSGLTLVLGVAATGSAGPRLALGDFILLQAFAFRLALPLTGLIGALRQLGLPLATIEQALKRGEPRHGRAQASFEASAAPQAHDKALRLDAVSFAYPGGGSGVTTVTLGLQAGQLVALVGANGSGKSTLAQLMAGLILPNTGRVVAEGVALRGIAPPDRTKLVLYVPQFISLFNRSILDNGLYPPASLDPAALAERLSRWRFRPDPGPLDLSTPVGERGQKLSGGQVQKLELARLCSVDASILILDESTSALDAPSEAEALNDLQTRRPNRLLILITHRLALVERADQVVFMRAGRLAGLGRHDALLADDAYARLWR